MAKANSPPTRHGFLLPINRLSKLPFGRKQLSSAVEPMKCSHCEGFVPLPKEPASEDGDTGLIVRVRPRAPRKIAAIGPMSQNAGAQASQRKDAVASCLLHFRKVLQRRRHSFQVSGVRARGWRWQSS